MALTLGNGPLGRRPAGRSNFQIVGPAHQLYLEPFGPRVRIVVAGEVVADTTSALLLYETGLFPVIYLPAADVRSEVLEASQTRTHCPFKGDATYHHLRVAGVQRRDAVWSYPDPIEGCPPLAALVAFDPAAVDAVYLEEEQVRGHVRDPYHRVDAVPTSRHVTVRVDGQVVADSHRAVLVFETGLPVRTYLPAGDVDTAVLESSDTVTTCPYKGTTGRYHSVRVGERHLEDAVWVYEDPDPSVAAIAGLLAFDDAQVEVAHDHEPFAPPPARPA